MSSGTSTERRADGPGSFQASHFYLIASMVAATVAVMTARNTHPLALLLLSGAAIAAGLVGLALHRSAAGFFGLGQDATVPATTRRTEILTREKALLLRSIKELEFDHAMGKVSEADFKDIDGRLRTRALALMQDLERAARAPVEAAPSAPAARRSTCASCGSQNDEDARFCKKCGAKL
jgi:zinc-ribbon domain